METFLAVLILLGLIGVSNVLNRYVPFIPVPLIQIALGIVVAVLPSGVHLPLEPELFFVLFIAPLLYNDGKHTPRDELWKLRAPILLLAVGLVFITVFAVGYAIHGMIPTIPLPAAFGLAAILSPTDAVAVSALAGRIHLPKSMMRLLEGEALMNDASGLVAFKFAIAAAVTGVFSLPKASVSFVLISLGGLAIGAALAFLITWIRLLLRRSGMEDVTMHMLIQILTPFILYITAEELGMSGILAAVAGGIVHAIERDRTESPILNLKTVSDNTWSVILFILNGLVFVILGLQIPGVSRVILSDPAFDNFKVIGYAVAIFAMLIALRFGWLFAFTRTPRFFGGNEDKKPLGLKMLVMTSFSGVRGAVTLAGAFSIPLVVEGGGPFPERNLILFLAALVILLSLIAASVLLPLLAKKKGSEASAEAEQNEREIRIKVLKAAVQAVMLMKEEHEHKAAAASVIADYRKWIHEARTSGDSGRRPTRSRETETELRLLAIGAEREYVRNMLRDEEINREQAARLMKRLDQAELIVSNRTHLWKMTFKLLFRRIKAGLTPGRRSTDDKLSGNELETLRKAKIQTCQAAIREVNKIRCADNEEESYGIVTFYNEVVDRLSRTSLTTGRTDPAFLDAKKELRWTAIQAERDEVQSLFEKGEISREIAGDLRRMIRDREAAMFEQDEM
ncbi:Na+/H+ antiporter [Cohnella faecalis]|uniref:Na+/H+ antiporter n=1 Tax=Cohnella faecalis TaxID=2315694 RepID=A0A398CMG2_9BACL|nr:Na+/H+ antiporter [Cohnella faecalis]RIE03440.1 Na+/H+ antiporter [Cohnella faecalis]